MKSGMRTAAGRLGVLCTEDTRLGNVDLINYELDKRETGLCCVGSLLSLVSEFVFVLPAQGGCKLLPNESNVSVLRPRKWPITGPWIQADSMAQCRSRRQRPSLACVMPSLPGLQGCRRLQAGNWVRGGFCLDYISTAPSSASAAGGQQLGLASTSTRVGTSRYTV